MIIDFHVHLTPIPPDREWVWKQWPGTTYSGITAEDSIAKMDVCKPRIDKTLAFGAKSLVSETAQAMTEENNYILGIVRKYPQRFVGAGVVDASWGDKAIEELHRFVEAGLRVVKIRFSSFHFHANSKAGQRVFSEIEKLGVLPVCHSDWTHYSNPLILGDLAMMFPELKMVIQHFGEYLSLDAMSVAKKADNIYVDTSALVHPKNVIKFMKEISPDRIMFASDTLSIRGGLQPQDALDRILCLDLPKNDLDKVLGDNAVNLLRSVGVKT